MNSTFRTNHSWLEQIPRLSRRTPSGSVSLPKGSNVIETAVCGGESLEDLQQDSCRQGTMVNRRV